ncbi:MAG TPA: hypothetical protein DGO89_13075 [Microcoleaceae bacterium UBA9251]|nr:hypothetical protein [Microcoleaceae cyanobacterium UBA9251]
MTEYQSSPKPRIETSESLRLLAPDLIRVARSVYGLYIKVNSDLIKRPVGVVVSPGSDRGQLIFAAPPILLPGERFVSFEEIESQMY